MNYSSTSERDQTGSTAVSRDAARRDVTHVRLDDRVHVINF